MAKRATRGCGTSLEATAATSNSWSLAKTIFVGIEEKAQILPVVYSLVVLAGIDVLLQRHERGSELL